MDTPDFPYSGPIVTRLEAKAAGITRFFTGEPCEHGHIAQRSTSNRSCLACNAAKMRQYRKDHPGRVKASKRRTYEKTYDKIIARNRAWEAANPEKRKAYVKREVERNKEKRAQRYKKWAKSRPDLVAAKSKRWHKRHPEAAHINNANRRARKKAAGGRFTRADIDRIYDAQRGRCAICREKVDRKAIHRDHIVPLTKGGSNKPRNIQVACKDCNLRKRNDDPIEFMRSLGRLL